MANKKDQMGKLKDTDTSVKDAKPLHKTSDSGDSIWGMLLIVGGVIFLLNTVGFISWDIWSTLGMLWPVLLILWGMQIILGNSRVARGIMIIISAVVLVIIALFAVGQERPELRAQMPDILEPVFTGMEGIYK